MSSTSGLIFGRALGLITVVLVLLPSATGERPGMHGHARIAPELDEPPFCLTIQPPMIGGLSKSAGLVNAAMTWAAGSGKGKFRVVIPSFEVVATHTDQDPGRGGTGGRQLFADLFTGALPAMRMDRHAHHKEIKDIGVPFVWDLRRPRGRCDGFSNRCSLTMLELNGTALGKLNVTALAHKYAATPGYTSHEPWDGSGIFDGCKVVLVAPGRYLMWNYDYNQTYRTFRKLFWAGHPLPETCRCAMSALCNATERVGCKPGVCPLSAAPHL